MSDFASFITGGASSSKKPQYFVEDVQNMIYGQESDFGKLDTSKPNYAGAIGPGQILPKTWEGAKKQGLIPVDYDINNPKHNLAGSKALVADAYKRYEGDADKVLAEYYAGAKAIKDGQIQTDLKDLKNDKAPNVGQYIDQAKAKFSGMGDDFSKFIMGGATKAEDTSKATPTEDNRTTIAKMGDISKRLGKEFIKPLSEISGQDWQEKSLSSPVIAYTASSLGIPGFTEADKKSSEEKLIKKGKNLIEGVTKLVTEPVNTLSDIAKNIYDNPAKFAGETVKSIIYDPEQLVAIPGAGKAIEKVAESGSKAKAVLSEKLNQAFPKMDEVKPAITMQVDPAMVGVGAAESSLVNRVQTALNEAPDYLKQSLKDIPVEKLATPENLKAIENHNKFAKFDLTPTEGQALENTSLMSSEFNSRKLDPNLQARFEERDPKLIQGFNNIKEKATPDVFENDPQRLASMPLDKVKNIYQQKEQNVSNLWNEANLSAGTSQAPIDVGALRENIINGLKEKSRSRYVPTALQADLDEVLTKGFITPSEYENLRSDTATIARTNPDPMARQAAYIIRQKLEQVPLKDEFAQYKPKFDAARKATQDLHNFEKSSIVKAAISDTRTPDEIAAGMPHPAAKNFISQHYSAKTPQVDIERMLDLIGRNSPEHQALNKLKIDEFKLNSGIVNDKGTISQNALNKQIHEQHKTNLAPMFGQEVAKDLQDLADVANLTEPRKGVHSVNVSNTEILRQENAAKAAKDAASNIVAGGAEAIANAKIPFSGTIIRKTFGGYKAEKEAKAAAKMAQEESERRLSPKAGIQLKDIGKK